MSWIPDLDFPPVPARAYIPGTDVVAAKSVWNEKDDVGDRDDFDVLTGRRVRSGIV